MQLPCTLGLLLLPFLQDDGAPPKPPAVDQDAESTTSANAAPEPADSEMTPVDQLVPANALVHAELRGWDEIGAAVKETSLWQLAAEEEVRRFMAPLFDDLVGDVHWFLHDHPKRPEQLDVATIEKMLADPRCGTLTVTVLESDEGERVPLILSAELHEFAEPVFEMLKSAFQSVAEEQNDIASLSEIEVAGHKVLRIDHEEYDGVSGDFVLDGSRLFLAVGEKLADALFDPSADKLAGAEWYQQARAGLGIQSPVLTLAVNLTPVYEMLSDASQSLAQFSADALGIDPEELLEGSEETEAARRILLESSFATSAKAFAMGWSIDGKDLVERWYLNAPGDRSGWSMGTQFAGVVEEHASLTDPDADLFVSMTYDLGRALEMARNGRLHESAIYEEYGLDTESLDFVDILRACEEIDQALGVDLTEVLIPSLGDRMSMWMDMPSGLQGLPSVGVILDVADADGFDAALDLLVNAADQQPEVSTTSTEFKGIRVVSVNLINAGLPIIPSVARVGEQALLTLSPMDLKSAIRGQQNGKHLGASERLKPMREHLGQGSHGAAGWADLRGLLGLAYVSLSGILGVLPLETIDQVPVDFALLPNATILFQHFGPALASMSEDEAGIRLETRSTLGNPLSGLALLGAGLAFGFAGASELKSNVREAKQDLAEAQLEELGLAMRAYRESVGGGRWPESLTQLVDRGILLDAKKLVDPADPKPKKVRTSTGDRLPLSYLLGKPEALPEHLIRNAYDLILYTRGPWYGRSGTPARLVLCLASDGKSTLITVPENVFSK